MKAPSLLLIAILCDKKWRWNTSRAIWYFVDAHRQLFACAAVCMKNETIKIDISFAFSSLHSLPDCERPEDECWMLYYITLLHRLDCIIDLWRRPYRAQLPRGSFCGFSFNALHNLWISASTASFRFRSQRSTSLVPRKLKVHRWVNPDALRLILIVSTTWDLALFRANTKNRRKSVSQRNLDQIGNNFSLRNLKLHLFDHLDRFDSHFANFSGKLI